MSGNAKTLHRSQHDRRSSVRCVGHSYSSIRRNGRPFERKRSTRDARIAAWFAKHSGHTSDFSKDVVSKETYFRARRVGRGTRLGRKQRAEVWPVLARYRELIDVEGLLEWQDVVREARLFLQGSDIVLPYKAVLADEVQSCVLQMDDAREGR